MKKTTKLSIGNLIIEHTSGAAAVDPISMQANLNTMVPYINQILEALPATEKVQFLKMMHIQKEHSY